MPANAIQQTKVAPTPAMALSTFLQSRQSQIMDVLPLDKRKPDEANRLIRVLMASCIKTPKIMQCTKESVLMALVNCAEMNIEPNTPKQLAVIIPYENRKKGTVEAQFQFMYKGLVEIATRTKVVKQIYAYPVFKGDAFKVTLGSEPRIVHDPHFQGETPDKLTHVYAIAVLADGRLQQEVMTKAQVDAIRGRSRSKDDGPWVTDYVAMGIKTVVKRLMKLLPQTAETSRALELDTAADIGAPAPRAPENLDEIVRRADIAAVETPEAEEPAWSPPPQSRGPASEAGAKGKTIDVEADQSSGVIETMVTEVVAKKGKNGADRFEVRCDNGHSYFTFSKTLKEVASNALADGNGVKIVFETGEYGHDILQIVQI